MSMSNIQRNFQKSYSLYQLKGPFLPPKISWKLDLIIYMVQGNIPNKQILSMQQLMELQDLQNLDNQGLKLVFNNIIDTLFNKQTVEIKKCQIKKKGIFTNWINGNVHYDKQSFLLNISHKTYTFQKINCQIKKTKQSKRSLQLYFKGSHKYTLKFLNQQEMRSIWHNWQKQIIDVKTQQNYLQMKTYINLQQSHPAFMEKISLFCLSPPKSSKSQNKMSLSPHSTTFNSFQKQNLHTIQFSQINHKKKQQQNVNLKPVPHNFICKLKTTKSIIALSKDDDAKIYIEYIFSIKMQQKRLLSFLLLQKCWNKYLVMEYIQKLDAPNEIKICRKYDTFKELGKFIQMNLKATYSAWSPNMSIITVQTINELQKDNQISSNSVITVQSAKDKVRILIEQHLTSTRYSTDKLKSVLFDMYRQIIKLQLIHEKIVFKDFQAQTIITNILEDEQSTNVQSQQDIEYLQLKQQSFEKEEVKQLQKNEQKTASSLKNFDQLVIKLKSPFQFPNPEYIKSIKNRQFQKNYFKFTFSQQILAQYQNYIPSYRLEKMVQNKIYQITPNRQLKFIDQQLIDSQKQTLRFVFRQIGANLISGKSILNVSFPVDIFQSRSGLQRSASSFACCPDYLIPIANSSTLQQIKLVTAFIINVTSCQLVMQKPFNPILGQSFQGYIKGIPIYYEQISHNPPISSFYMTCPQFTLYGNLIPFVDVGLNTGVGGNLGPMNIIFNNGTHFQCYFPPSQISGLIYGDRKFRCYNKGFIFEKKSKLYSEFSVQNQKKGVYESPIKLKGGQIIGGIYKVKNEFMQQMEKYKKQYKNMKKFGGLTKQMILQKLCSISGQWFSKVIIDDKVINENKMLYPVEYAKNVLPSDSNHRLDILYHKMKDLTHSQKEKQYLQNIQRNDKKLREKKTSS